MEKVPGCGYIERKLRQGHPRAPTTKDRHFFILVRRNKEDTDSQLARDLYAATGTRVITVTISKRLNEKGVFARRPSVCVPITSMNRRIWLASSRYHSDWIMEHWPTVLFTTESCFSLNTDSRRSFKQRAVKITIMAITLFWSGQASCWTTNCYRYWELPYFQDDITLRGIYSCKRGPY